MDAISSAISSCDLEFDSVAVPLRETLAEKAFENVGTIKQLYERRVAGKPTEDVAIADYPQLRDILTDLSLPALWESMKRGGSGTTSLHIVSEQGLAKKYDMGWMAAKRKEAMACYSSFYYTSVKEAGISCAIFEEVLNAMMK